MFPSDPQVLAILSGAPPRDVSGVISELRRLDAALADNDGLKWFNWLYLLTTRAVKQYLDTGQAQAGQFISELDVAFAQLYRSALTAYLSGDDFPASWDALFSARGDERITRIQFALAGVNAHINRDLPIALLTVYDERNMRPVHGGVEYVAYTDLNTTLDAQIGLAKQNLMVRLDGANLASVDLLEIRIAAWSVAAAREAAWTNSEILFTLSAAPLRSRYEKTLDGLSQLASKALLAPV
ncbi:MAG TPA: DUF5995 family protein [Bryobacteraceae bacterium]|jgi:hypothetical protein|nr:DUF5995 family protein [Bryobacteraceae bacterium]